VTEYELLEYNDDYTFVLWETSERAPMRLLPNSVNLVINHDLVDRIKPEDRVQIMGVYKALVTSVQGKQVLVGCFALLYW